MKFDHYGLTVDLRENSVWIFVGDYRLHKFTPMDLGYPKGRKETLRALLRKIGKSPAAVNKFMEITREQVDRRTKTLDIQRRACEEFERRRRR